MDNNIRLEWTNEDEAWFQEMQANKEQEMEEEGKYRDQSRNGEVS